MMIGLKWMKKVIPLHPTRRGYFFHFKSSGTDRLKGKRMSPGSGEDQSGILGYYGLMAGLSAGKETNIRTVDRGYSCPAYALLLGSVLPVSLCTAVAPLSAGWMHQSRYCCPDLCYCSSAAVAYSSPLFRRLAGVYFAGMWPRGTRESNGRGPAATTAMWPAVLTGEGRASRPPGSYPPDRP